MKLRRTLRYHGLKRGRVRQTWNKYNLFSLSRLQRNIPEFTWKTFFQQKWAAKALTRAYHGEHIKERKWERMFSRRMNSVVNMDPAYMAAHDGSEQAAGRGSGKDEPSEVDTTPEEETSIQKQGWKQGLEASNQGDRKAGRRSNTQIIGGGEGRTPYMSMVYAPLERRLDIAVFRALFASSARQARQFCVHGAVKVNGQEMRYPGYLLNPGDMFQVDPENVMYATGKKKAGGVVGFGKPKKKAAEAEEAEAEEAAKEEDAELAAKAAEELSEAEQVDAEIEAGAALKTETLSPEKALERLKRLSRYAKELLQGAKGQMKPKQKIKIRHFIASAKSSISRAGKTPTTESVAGNRNLMDEITQLIDQLSVTKPDKPAELVQLETEAGVEKAPDADAALKAAEAEAAEAAKPKNKGNLSDDELAIFNRILKEEEENPTDPSKPYHTPWQPRRYMNAFAFIPRYLEVNQNVCAAVYLRHPVARQGLGEVPTPFPPNIMQLTFNWYLRRR